MNIVKVDSRFFRFGSARRGVRCVHSSAADILVSDPVQFGAWLLGSLHNASHLPWWAVVPAAAFAVRAATAPLLSLHRERTARLLRPIAPQLRSAALSALTAWTERTEPRAVVVRRWLLERRRLLKLCSAGHVSRNVFLYAYFPVVIAHVLALRYAVTVDAASFAAEGALWFPSLAAHDPWLRLALISCLVSLYNLGRPPAVHHTPVSLLGYWASFFGICAIVPISHFFLLPEAIPLHFIGAAGFRLTQKLWGIAVAKRTAKAELQKNLTTKNPRW